MKAAMVRYQEAAEASPLGKEMFTLAFLGALSVGYDPHGRTDKDAWDRCLRIAGESVDKLAVEKFERAAERAKGLAA